MESPEYHMIEEVTHHYQPHAVIEFIPEFDEDSKHILVIDELGASFRVLASDPSFGCLAAAAQRKHLKGRRQMPYLDMFPTMEASFPDWRLQMPLVPLPPFWLWAGPSPLSFSRSLVPRFRVHDPRFQLHNVQYLERLRLFVEHCHFELQDGEEVEPGTLLHLLIHDRSSLFEDIYAPVFFIRQVQLVVVNMALDKKLDRVIDIRDACIRMQTS